MQPKPESDILGNPAVRSLGEPARAAFLELASIAKVAVHDADLGGDIEPDLVELEKAGLVVRWHYRDAPAVTLSSIAAEFLDIRTDQYGRNWVSRKAREPRVRVKRRKLEDGTQVISETDMAVDPPGQLDQQSDPGVIDPAEAVAEAEEHIREAERVAGHPRPLFLCGGDMMWPVAQQERGPLAPDPGPVPPGRKGWGMDLPGPCGGCGGTVGRQESCLACDAYYADAFLPKGIRNSARSAMDRAGKTERAEVSKHMKAMKKMREGESS